MPWYGQRVAGTKKTAAQRGSWLVSGRLARGKMHKEEGALAKLGMLGTGLFLSLLGLPRSLRNLSLSHDGFASQG